MKNLELSNVKGSIDFEGNDQVIRNYIENTLKEVFERYGYKPLSTSILCYYDLLALKYDENNDILKEIYKVQDQGNRNLALRYDLTVPFAKYIAINPEIKMPYKRYEIGKVFRDGPVKQGRLREFIQCDVDSVGIEGQMVEAEIIALLVEGYSKLGIDVVIKYNNRKLMSGLIKESKIEDEKIDKAITIIDKFDKLSKEEITNEFLNIGLKSENINLLLENLKLDFDKIKSKYITTDNVELREGIQEIDKLNEYIEKLELNKYVEFSSSLARGQEYYTGTIFEAYIKTGEIKSSIGGGGRYDKMIGDFIGNGKKYPAVGVSFGLDVIFEILKKKNSVKTNNTLVYIIPMNNKVEALKIANKLRKNGINTDIEMNDKKLRKSLDYANYEKIPYVIIIGEEELKENKIILKNMETNLQKIIDINTVIEELKNIDDSNYNSDNNLKRKYTYKIFNPGGNKTALVIGDEYSKDEKKIINDEILKENIDVEQVGFISTKEKKLNMAGGEFCVNATRCAIWQYLSGKEGKMDIKVSGMKSKIQGGIDSNKNVYAIMNINKDISNLVEEKEGICLIKLDGITLGVINEYTSKSYIEELKTNEEKAKQRLKEIMKKFNTNENAVGIILTEKIDEECKDKIKIYPIIWVRTIDTLYYETACGSGSLAVSIYKNYICGIKKLEVIQTSNYSINVNITTENNKECKILNSAEISGVVLS